MTYIQFQELSQNKQFSNITTNCLLLSKSEIYAYRNMLYRVDKFHVEEYLNRQTNSFGDCNSIYFINRKSYYCTYLQRLLKANFA